MGNYSNSSSQFDHFSKVELEEFLKFWFKIFFFSFAHQNVSKAVKSFAMLRKLIFYYSTFYYDCLLFQSLYFLFMDVRLEVGKRRNREWEIVGYMQCSTVWFILKLNQHPWILCSYFAKCAPRQEKSGIKWIIQ